MDDNLDNMDWAPADLPNWRVYPRTTRQIASDLAHRLVRGPELDAATAKIASRCRSPLTSDMLLQIHDQVARRGGGFRTSSLKAQKSPFKVQEELEKLLGSVNTLLRQCQENPAASREERLMVKFKIASLFMARFLMKVDPFLDGNCRTAEVVVSAILADDLGFYMKFLTPQGSEERKNLLFSMKECQQEEGRKPDESFASGNVNAPRHLAAFLIDAAAGDLKLEHDALAQIGVADDALKRQDYEKAEQLLNAILARQPRAALHLIYFLRWEARMANGDFRGALEDAYRCCQADPKFAMGEIAKCRAILVAEIHHVGKRLTLARAAFSAAQRLDQHVADAHQKLKKQLFA